MDNKGIMIWLCIAIYIAQHLGDDHHECDLCVVVEPDLLGGDLSLTGNYRFDILAVSSAKNFRELPDSLRR